MTPAELDAIEARASKATPGPWEDCGDERIVSACDRSHPLHGLYVTRACLTPDRAFIAAARTDVPALVAEVRRLRAALREIRLHGESDEQTMIAGAALGDDP